MAVLVLTRRRPWAAGWFPLPSAPLPFTFSEIIRPARSGAEGRALALMISRGPTVDGGESGVGKGRAGEEACRDVRGGLKRAGIMCRLAFGGRARWPGEERGMAMS